MMFTLDEDVVSDDGDRRNDAASNASDDDLESTAATTTPMKFAPKGNSSIRQTPVRNLTARPTPTLAMSLPVNIANNNMFTRMDSFMDEDADDEDEDIEEEDVVEGESSQSGDAARQRSKTIISAREDRMYRNMRAYSRSIQPVDDPERLFGERPHRRYRATEQSGGDNSADTQCDVAEAIRAMQKNARMNGTVCSLSTAPIIANDLNATGQTARAGDNGSGTMNSTSGNSIGVTRIIMPSSYAGRLL